MTTGIWYVAAVGDSFIRKYSVKFKKNSGHEFNGFVRNNKYKFGKQSWIVFRSKVAIHNLYYLRS